MRIGDRAWKALGPEGVNRLYRAVAVPRRTEPRPPPPWVGPPSFPERLGIRRQGFACALCHALFVGAMPPVADRDLPLDLRGCSDAFYATLKDRPAEFWEVARDGRRRFEEYGPGVRA